MATILIVDDERPVRSVLNQMLERKGHDCFLAESAGEARQYLEQQHFDLILSDIMMPEESGIELVRFIMSEYKETAVIMVTGIDDPQIADMVINEGVYDYIVKPIQKNRVMTSVINSLRRRELEISNRRHQIDLERNVLERTASLQHTIHNLEETQNALRESEKRYRELIQSTNSIILRLSPDGKINFINEFGKEFLGYSEEELIGRHITGTIVPEVDSSGDNLHDKINRVLKEPDEYRFFANRNICKDKSLVRVAWANKGVYNPDGRLAEIISIGNVISEAEPGIK